MKNIIENIFTHIEVHVEVYSHEGYVYNLDKLVYLLRMLRRKLKATKNKNIAKEIAVIEYTVQFNKTNSNNRISEKYMKNVINDIKTKLIGVGYETKKIMNEEVISVARGKRGKIVVGGRKHDYKINILTQPDVLIAKKSKSK